MIIKHAFMIYDNDPKFSDEHVWENSVEPDQMIRVCTVNLLDTLLYLQTTVFNFRIITAFFSGVQIFFDFTVTFLLSTC